MHTDSHMHTGSHMHRAGLGTAGARLCRADDTGGWTRWRPPAPRPADHCSRTPSGADLFAVCRPNPQRSAGRPLRGRRGRAHDAVIERRARGRVEVCRWARWRCRWAPPCSLSPLVFAPSGADRARAGAVRLAARRPTAHEHSATHRWAFFEHGRPFFSQKTRICQGIVHS